MWQRFTERARKVVFYAQEEAGKLGENYVSTEHLLLGLVHEEDNVASRILIRMGIRPDMIRHELERQLTPGDGRLGQDMQLTPRAKRIIDLAYEEARTLNNNYIGTEHLLLGMIHEGDGLAARVLLKLGVDLDQTREEVRLLQAGREKDKAQDDAKKDEVKDEAKKESAAPPANLHQQAYDAEAAIVRLAESVLGMAFREEASELYLEPGQHGLRVLLRRHGTLTEAMTIPGSVQYALLARIRAMAGMDAKDVPRAQQGVINFPWSWGRRLVGVSAAPTPEGERLVMTLDKVEPDAAAPPVNKPSQRMAAPRGTSPLADVLTEHRLRGRDILGIEQLTQEEILLVLDVAARLKANKFDATQTQFAQGQTLAMLFEKPSLRTRVTFEAGMNQLGGHAIYLEGRLGQRETVPDVARNLDRWLDGIMARTFDHQTVLELAEYANVPVINGLSDREHPCQAFADFQTLAERKGALRGLKLAYVGDGNNVAQSLMLLAAKVGTHFSLSCPEGYEPDAALWQTALDAAQAMGAVLTLTHDPAEGVVNADAIYTDVWASMGQEDEAAARAEVFAPFQVNAALVEKAKADALIMHCLPAHRGEEIAEDVIEGPNSVVFDQAENRLHAQKAVLALVM